MVDIAYILTFVATSKAAEAILPKVFGKLRGILTEKFGNRDTASEEVAKIEGAILEKDTDLTKQHLERLGLLQDDSVGALVAVVQESLNAQQDDASQNLLRSVNKVIEAAAASGSGKSQVGVITGANASVTFNQS